MISEIQGAESGAFWPRYARVELRVYISDDDDPGREALVPDVRVETGPKRKGSGKSKVLPGAVPLTRAADRPNLDG